jgi:NAD(P)-dependent dehydrogenase (short-subunit alcohol dehydrogenase family)
MTASAAPSPTIKEALGRPCDIIVSNSGMSRDTWFRDQSEDDWNAVIDTNLNGVWRVGKHTRRTP